MGNSSGRFRNKNLHDQKTFMIRNIPQILENINI